MTKGPSEETKKRWAVDKLMAAYEEARPYLDHPLILWAPQGRLEDGFYCFGITPEQFDKLRELIKND